MANDRATPWQLVEARKYRDAAELYWREYEKSQDTLALRGCARALLYDGHAAEALPHFKALIAATEERHRADCDFISLGTCHWYLRQPQQAVAAWRESFTAPYTDAAGGVVRSSILLYAATRLRDTRLEAEALSRLQTLVKRHLQHIRRGPPMSARQAHEDLVHPGLFAWPGALAGC